MTKQKSTKRALLLSALSLMMCVSMLIGSTYAWFTDSATSGSNVIQSGTLDIVLEYSTDGGSTWKDAEGEVLNFKKANTAAGTEVLWEPGCTYELPAIRVRNEGNLAANVLLKINGITGDEKLMEAITFQTKVSEIPETLLSGSNADTFKKLNDAKMDLYYGTPDGTVVADWSLAPKDEITPNTGHTDTTAVFTIFGHMSEEAGNEYQGLQIEGVSITAIATQQVYEYDSFGRDYDENAGFDEGKSNVGPYSLNVLSNGFASYDENTKTYNIDVDSVAQGSWNEAQGNYYAGYTVNVAGYGENATVKFNKQDGTEVTWMLSDEEKDGFINNGVHQQWTAVGLNSAYRYDVDGDGVTDFTVVNDASEAMVEVADKDQLSKVIESEGVSAILTKDISMTVETTGFTINKDVDVKIDLNGHDITATSTSVENVQVFSVNGKLDIVGNGTVSLTNPDYAWTDASRYTAINIREAGVVTLGEGVNVICTTGESTEKGYGMSYAVDIYKTGTLNVNGASLHSNYIAVRCFYGASVVNVNSGSITSSLNNWGIWPQNADDAVITVADGIDYTTDDYGIYIFN